jgi:hypothetical protein
MRVRVPEVTLKVKNGLARPLLTATKPTGERVAKCSQLVEVRCIKRVCGESIQVFNRKERECSWLRDSHYW